MHEVAEFIVLMGILAGYGLVIGPIACLIAALFSDN
jgi:hypothetical protein